MITYAVFKLFEFILMRLPHRARKGFFLFLAAVAYRLDPSHRRIIRQNITFAYGEDADEAFIMHVSKYCYKNLMLNFLQMIENRHLDIETLAKKVSFEPPEIVEKIKESGKPIVIATGHFGRWELAGIASSALLKPTMIVYKEMKNIRFQHYLNESRERFRISSTEKHGAVKDLVKQLRKGFSISLLVDTNLKATDGVLVDFFGHPTRTTLTTAYLARKYDALIVPGFITTEDEEHFTVRFSEPFKVAQTDDPDADLKAATQKQAEALEAVVRAYPHLWFWCHKRWKTDFPELYKKEA